MPERVAQVCPAKSVEIVVKIGSEARMPNADSTHEMRVTILPYRIVSKIK